MPLVISFVHGATEQLYLEVSISVYSRNHVTMMVMRIDTLVSHIDERAPPLNTTLDTKPSFPMPRHHSPPPPLLSSFPLLLLNGSRAHTITPRPPVQCTLGSLGGSA